MVVLNYIYIQVKSNSNFRTLLTGRTSKQNTRNISSAISSQQTISGKNSESKKNCHEKFLKKSVFRSRL